MKVLVWTYASFQRNYSSYHLYEGMIKAILARGHEVVLVQKDYGEELSLPESLSSRPGVTCIELPVGVDKTAGLVTRYFDDLVYTKRAFNRIKRETGFDVALVQSNNCPFAPVGLLRKWGIPVVYNEQDIFPENAIASGMLPGGGFGVLANRLTGIAYRKASAVITISDDMAETVELLGGDKRKIWVVHNWCRKDRDYLVSDDDNAFLRAVDNVDDDYRVIYAGNVGRMQGVDVLVEAASLLRDESICFYIVGDGAAKGSLEERCAQLGLTNVRFCRGLPEIDSQDIYAAADLNVITLRGGIIHTCLPSKTAVCVHSRRPYVATVIDGSHAADLYRMAEYGSVVPPESPKLLAEQILRMRDRYGKRYLAERDENVEAMFSEENAFKYAHILECVAGKADCIHEEKD